MSAPPLPEIFGNYALGEFVEAVPPAAVSWWPQTPGWWWLGAALLVFIGHRGWRALRHWYRNRYRREAAARLEQLAAAQPTGELIPEINRLLKLTALAAYSRDQVARLSGHDWVTFLNARCPVPPFSPEQGQLLAVASYAGVEVASPAADQLLAASLSWINQHENPADV
jgi:hypothetical protein